MDHRLPAAPAPRVPVRVRRRRFRSYAFRHDVTFGAPAARRARVSRGRSAACLVGTPDGEPGIPGAAGPKPVAARAGRPLRLHRVAGRSRPARALLPATGALRRQIATDATTRKGGLDLHHRRRTETRVRVMGTTLPDHVLREIETAWTQAVFEGFLIEEAVDIVRRELALQAAYEPSLEVRVEGNESDPDAGHRRDPGAARAANRRAVRRGRRIAEVGSARRTGRPRSAGADRPAGLRTCGAGRPARAGIRAGIGGGRRADVRRDRGRRPGDPERGTAVSRKRSELRRHGRHPSRRPARGGGHRARSALSSRGGGHRASHAAGAISAGGLRQGVVHGAPDASPVGRRGRRGLRCQ